MKSNFIKVVHLNLTVGMGSLGAMAKGSSDQVASNQITRQTNSYQKVSKAVFHIKVT